MSYFQTNFKTGKKTGCMAIHQGGKKSVEPVPEETQTLELQSKDF